MSAKRPLNGNIGERCLPHNADAALFCMTCPAVVCIDCFELDHHRQHDIVTLSKARKELDAKLQSALCNAQQILQGKGHANGPLGNPIVVKLSALVDRVQIAAQQLHRAVDAFETSLVARVLQCAGTSEMERADEQLAQTCFEESLRALVHKAATCWSSEMAAKRC